VETIAWTEVVTPPLEGRSAKPRRRGLTMVLDKGLGLSAFEDLLDMCCEYVDVVKLSFGTSVLHPPHALRSKLDLARRHGVDTCPGGTLLEVAITQRRLARFLNGAAEAGFTMVEVSDGVIALDPDERARVVEAATRAGFKVVTEVGKKDPDLGMRPSELCEQARADLDSGAFKVIIEARESGRGIGIYAEDGSVRMDDLEEILAGVDDPDDLMWEAPLKGQQVALIRRLGPDVNLGNVAPGELMALEALRRGLRADTMSVLPDWLRHPERADAVRS